MDGNSALGAGILLVAATAIGAALGLLIGSPFDLRLVGALVGGVLGTVLGFVMVWRRFVAPMDAADATRDYSNMKRVEDDDNDDW